MVVGETRSAKCSQLCRKTWHWVSPLEHLPASQLLATPPELTPQRQLEDWALQT